MPRKKANPAARKEQAKLQAKLAAAGKPKSGRKKQASMSGVALAAAIAAATFRRGPQG